MNTPKAIELAYCSMLRQYAELGAETLLRPWQSLADEYGFAAGNDRKFPCIDVRFTPDEYNEDQTTLACRGQITAMSRVEDDPDNAQVSAMYEAIHAVCLSIFSDAMGRTSYGRYAEFAAAVLSYTGNQCRVGGITLEPGIAPMLDEQNLSAIGLGFAVHFSYSHT
jgi:hypothetical protein